MQDEEVIVWTWKDKPLDIPKSKLFCSGTRFTVLETDLVRACVLMRCLDNEAVEFVSFVILHNFMTVLAVENYKEVESDRFDNLDLD